MERTYTCIVCPRGCRITVAEGPEGPVTSGQGCPRGRDYALAEHVRPMRTITTTVALDGSRARRLPVVGTAPVPRELLRPCLEEVYRVRVEAPVAAGQVVLANVLGSGVDVVAAAPAEAAGEAPGAGGATARRAVVTRGRR